MIAVTWRSSVHIIYLCNPYTSISVYTWYLLHRMIRVFFLFLLTLSTLACRVRVRSREICTLADKWFNKRLMENRFAFMILCTYLKQCCSLSVLMYKRPCYVIWRLVFFMICQISISFILYLILNLKFLCTLFIISYYIVSAACYMLRANWW